MTGLARRDWILAWRLPHYSLVALTSGRSNGMADGASSDEALDAEGSGSVDGGIRRRAQTQYFSTARTAPRAPHESRIGTDEAHARLQAARNRARRDPERIRLDDVSADH
jgi:hypothetical protein